MKLHFEDNLDFQKTAIEAVADLFWGQDINHTEFTVSKLVDPSGQLKLAGMEESTLGIGNRLQLLDDELLENLKSIQLRNGLRLSDSLASGDFTVEMETGTGKTYVYLRTIFELNKRYGFTKFMIVVPSVAIKEGTYKTLQITRDHFENLYPNAKAMNIFFMTGPNPNVYASTLPTRISRSWWSRAVRLTKKTSTTSIRTVKRPAEKSLLIWCGRHTPSLLSMSRKVSMAA